MNTCGSLKILLSRMNFFFIGLQSSLQRHVRPWWDLWPVLPQHHIEVHLQWWSLRLCGCLLSLQLQKTHVKAHGPWCHWLLQARVLLLQWYWRLQLITEYERRSRLLQQHRHHPPKKPSQDTKLLLRGLKNYHRDAELSLFMVDDFWLGDEAGGNDSVIFKGLVMDSLTML